MSQLDRDSNSAAGMFKRTPRLSSLNQHGLQIILGIIRVSLLRKKSVYSTFSDFFSFFWASSFDHVSEPLGIITHGYVVEKAVDGEPFCF